MNRTNIGRVCVVARGAYSDTRDYDRLDAVTFGGSSYCCEKPCKGISPTDTEYWFLMAERGKDGAVSWTALTGKEKEHILSRLQLESLGFTNINGFYVCDGDGNTVLRYDDSGFDVTTLSDHAAFLIKSIEGVGLKFGDTPDTAYRGDLGSRNATAIVSLGVTLTALSSRVWSLLETVEDGFFLCDESGNVGLSYTSAGLDFATLGESGRSVLEDAGISGGLDYDIILDVDY